jgi:hypothetical protein
MTTNKIINATQDPQAANKLAADAMSAQEATVKALKPETKLPPATDVTLPAGLFDPFTGLITTAEVRELTGIDEEAISKITDTGKALLTVLNRGTVKIGEEASTENLLDSLYAGDREAILLAIRKVTFGSDVKLGPANCPHCGEEQVFDIDLDKDVPVKTLEGPGEFVLDCKVGKVVVTLPKGSAQKAIVASNNKTTAELDTIILSHCVVSINDATVIDPSVVRNLSIKDRRDILEEITNRNPGPQLSEIKVPCSACGTEVPLPLTLAELFR